MKPIDKPKEFNLAAGVPENFYPPGTNINGQQYRFTVVGAGTVDIQPVFKGITTHKPETVTNDTVILDYTRVDNFILTASGGSATVIGSVFGVS